MHIFNKNMRLLRVELGYRLNNLNITQDEVARMMRVHQQTLRGWEKNKTPSRNSLSRIAEFYSEQLGMRIAPDDLLKRDLSKPRHRKAIASTPLDEPVEEGYTRVPILGRVWAGDPNWTTDDVEQYYNLPNMFVPHDRCFLLRVTGDSMIEAGIRDGDVIIIDPKGRPRNGDIVVAAVQGEVTVKRFYRSDDSVILQPENAKYSPIVLEDPEADLTLAGKVIFSGKWH
jgi:repressor LexA